jgi:hypothetical protein
MKSLGSDGNPEAVGELEELTPKVQEAAVSTKKTRDA